MDDFIPTELQLAILATLWDLGEGTALEIHDRVRLERDVSQATVSVLLSRLGERGIVAVTSEGRSNRYRAVVDPATVERAVADEFGRRTRPLFGGRVAPILSRLLEIDDLDEEDVERARAILDAHRRGKAADDG